MNNLSSVVTKLTGKSVFNTEYYSANSFFNIYIKYFNSIVNGFNSNPTSLNKHIKRNFNFGYFEDLSFGGKAFINEETDFVYLNCGTIVYIHDLFLKLLANPTVFPEIGTPSINDYIIHKEPEINNGENQIIFHNGPSDSLRQDLALFLSHLALTYVTLHELGHHYNGHMLYLNTVLNENSLDMDNNSSTLNPLDYQTLEMDADAFAATTSINFIFFNLPEYQKNLFPPSLIQIIKESDILKYWIFSIHSLFCFLNKNNFNAENFADKKYLPLRIRQFLNFDIAYTTLASIIGDNLPRKDYEFLLQNTVVYTEEKFNQTFEKNMDELDLLSSTSTTVLNHVTKINDHWKNSIKPKLEKFSRATLAE
ncbi:hypothetical protein YDYSG_53360 [Paenibacillus tyrfis]|uniref:hypothetical protein n=1 Tax=Paenibacillus tyrfis TaxID=1501230 RepID=UPI00248FD536|nr:hypothetical protein [Paenibacillus tyrfis]GLI09304.1 hypothetical protein YDYSG_53360 [Paenibacillus tyrfis]